MRNQQSMILHANRPSQSGIPSILEGVPAFRHLLSTAKHVSLKEGDVLFRQGAPGDGCYWLEAGILSVSIASNKGDERVLAVLGPGSIVGELAMLDGLPRSATVRAIRDCTLAFLARATFKAGLCRDPDTYRYLVDVLVGRLRHADEEAAAATFLPVRARVARALLHLARYLGEPMTPGECDRIFIRHNLTHHDLAALAGVARESVSRTLSVWRDKGIVEPSGRAAQVVSLSALEAEAASGTCRELHKILNGQ